MNKNYIIRKENKNIGFINLFFILFLSFIISFVIVESYIISIISCFSITFCVFLLMNKKWFNTISIYDNKIDVKFTFKSKQSTNYKINFIREIMFYPYMSKTPSHIKIILKNDDVFRINISKKEVKPLFKKLEEKNIKTLFYNNKEIKFRS